VTIDEKAPQEKETGRLASPDTQVVGSRGRDQGGGSKMPSVKENGPKKGGKGGQQPLLKRVKKKKG